jgi:hypothetical protein
MLSKTYSPAILVMIVIPLGILTLVLAWWLKAMIAEDESLKDADVDRAIEWGNLQRELIVENEERLKKGLKPKLHPMTVPVPSRYKPPSPVTP